MARPTPNRKLEQELWDDGFDLVVGVDEVGRGAWAGPLMVGAAVLPRHKRVNGVRDSKMLSEARREELFDRVADWCEAWSVGAASHTECDELGMAEAQRLAARRAVEGLGIRPDAAVLDGKWNFLEGVVERVERRVKADVTCLPVAAASVLAKVTRDRIMREAAEHYPAWSFDTNKGYPCPRHKAALQGFGPSAIHRRSWVFMDNYVPWPGMRLVRPEAEQIAARYPAPVPHDQTSPAPGARIAIEGTLNFRDIGGYATADGRRLQTGLVYRSDHLNGVTADGLASLRALGLRTVVDLRRDDERQRQPSRLPDAVEVVWAHADAADRAAPGDFIAQVKAGEVVTVSEDEVVALYEEMLEGAGGMFRAVIEAAARADEGAVLFHCTAGKDRTGLSAMLLQRMCGVSEADVVSDFLLTDGYRTETRLAYLRTELEPLGIDVEGIRPMIVAPLPAFRHAISWVESHGGAEAYARDVCGVSTDTVARLRTTLIA